MSGKKITEQQATATLEQCKASKADPLFVDERPAKLQQAVAQGANGKEISRIVGVPENVASCAAVAYGLQEPSVLDKAKGWLTGAMNAAAAKVDDVATAVTNELKASQPGVNAGVAERGASKAEFCEATEKNPNPSKRDADIAAKICPAPGR